MSRSSAPSGDVRDSATGSAYPQADEDADGVSRATNGSVVAKLFAKTRVQVAVEDQVASHQNGTHGDHDDGATTANGTGDRSDASRHGELDWEDDDGVEDEYFPPPSDEESEESDEESDLDDEETSMRSLLLPMATYARQLLFLSDEEDDGEFDEQDAELWASPEEKRAWINQYEAKNRAHIEQYGCRIDASAVPDVKRRLRSERHREAKYSLVLLAFVIAYIIRLIIGPSSVAVDEAAKVVMPASDTSHADEVSAPAASQPSKPEWTPTSPPWWTVWTEDFVVRVFSWPKSILEYHRAEKKEDVVNENGVSEGEAKDEERAETKTEEPALTESPQIEPVVEEGQEVVDHEDTAEAFVLANGDSMAQTAGDDHSDGSPSEPAAFDTVETVSSNVIPQATVEEDTVVIETEEVVEVSSTIVAVTADRDEHLDISAASAAHYEVESAPSELPEREESQPTHDGLDSLQQCTDLFNLVVRTRNKGEVKADAIAACDRAVSESSELRSHSWIQAVILRGDLRSVLYSFADAQVDYSLVLSSAAEFAQIHDVVKLKMVANKWIELYHTKQYKQLRDESKRLQESTRDAPDRLYELAEQWVQVFDKKSPLLQVLTNTRGWTIYRPQLSLTESD